MGKYLTIMGYGVNASTFNSASAPPMTYGAAYLWRGSARSTTGLTAGQQTEKPVTTVQRVIALIGANGSVEHEHCS